MSSKGRIPGTAQPVLFHPLPMAPPMSPLYRKFSLPMAAAIVFGIGRFGWIVAAQALFSWLGAFVVAVSFSRIRHKKMDASFWITALLLSMSLPSHLPLPMFFLGSAVAQFFAKEVYGGFGGNVFNPAITGRVFLTLCFPAALATGWLAPTSAMGGFSAWTADAVSSATPLMAFRAAPGGSPAAIPDFPQSLWGFTGGSAGEGSAALFMAILVYMQVRKVGDLRFSYWFLGSLTALSTIGWALWPAKILPPHLQIVTGGVLCGAAFFCTDPVTSPRAPAAKAVCGILLGFLVLVIRSLSSFPEGFMFSLLMVNMFTPTIEGIFASQRKKAENSVVKKATEIEVSPGAAS